MTIALISGAAAKTGLSRQSMMRVASTATHRYKIYQIPKRRGGSRIVAQPAREVKAIQYAILDMLASHLPVHECATAYVPKSRLIDNASPHSGCKFLLKFDFESFFPSIDEHAVVRLLRSRIGERISEAEIRFVVDCCLWLGPGSQRRGLCIGAPSSPFLSNAVMFDFDQAISDSASKIDVIYTRYSDDVTFSSSNSNALGNMENIFRDLCFKIPFPRLQINESKRVFASRSAALKVTGLTLTNQGGVSVGRDRKRGVRAGLKHFMKDELDSESLEKLRGEVAFVLSIEPNFRDVLLRTYGGRVAEMLPKITK